MLSEQNMALSHPRLQSLAFGTAEVLEEVKCLGHCLARSKIYISISWNYYVCSHYYYHRELTLRSGLVLGAWKPSGGKL